MSSENAPTPSTITASRLKPEVVKNFGHPLPKKYENLLHLFVEMEKIVSIKHGRDMRIAFDDIAKNVMKNTKMTFNDTHLAQIMGVFSRAYDLRWEKHRQPIGKAQFGKNFDLILQPNLKSDLDQYLKEEALEWLKAKQSSPVKSIFSSQQTLFSPTKQLTSPKRNDRDNIHKTPTKAVPDVLVSPRKLQKTPIRKELEAKDQPQSLAQDGFRIVTPLLISPTKRTDRDYIKKSPVKRSPVKSMPNTPIRKLFVTDPKPRMEGWRLVARKMVFRHILVEKVKQLHLEFLESKKLCLKAGQLLHPEFELDGILEIIPGKIPQMPKVDAPLQTMRDFFDTVDKVILPRTSPVKQIQPSLPNSPEKPVKVSLLERIKAKEAALKAAKEQNDPTIEKRISALQFLKQSMVEVICSHFRTSKVGAMSLPTVREHVIISCGPIDKDKFMDFIDVLCSVAPKYCSKESYMADSMLKIANVRTDPKIYVKIMKCIENELTRMSMRKNIKAEVSTPESKVIETSKTKETPKIKSEVLSQAN